MTPWTDRAGAFSPTKAVAFALLFVPAIWLGWQWNAGALMPRELEAAIHETGLWATRILLLSLAITPLRSLLRWAELVPLRRMVGVAAFAYTALHVALYVAELKFDLLKVGSEIVTRLYLSIGFAAVLVLAVLAATSFDRAIRALGGERWRRIHKAVFAAGVLVLVHAVLQSKADASEAMLMIGILLWLMGWRVLKARERTGTAWLVGLSVAAAAATAGIEAGWYAAGTGIDAGRVLAANLDVAFGLRPALWVGLVGLLVTALAAVRRATKPKRRRVALAPA